MFPISQLFILPRKKVVRFLSSWSTEIRRKSREFVETRRAVAAPHSSRFFYRQRRYSNRVFIVSGMRTCLQPAAPATSPTAEAERHLASRNLWRHWLRPHRQVHREPEEGPGSWHEPFYFLKIEFFENKTAVYVFVIPPHFSSRIQIL